MSFQEYSIYGYGICDADNPCEVTKDRIEALLNLAPETAQNFHEQFGENFTIEDLYDYEGESCIIGVFALLCDVMCEAEWSKSPSDRIEFCACEDYYSNKYILYTPTFPWHMSDRERCMIAPGDIGVVFTKYTTILFGESATVDYYTCQNGG